jgi:hypothetical protein
MTIEILSTNRVGGPEGGYYKRAKHSSSSTGKTWIVVEMRFLSTTGALTSRASHTIRDGHDFWPFPS